MLEKSRCVLVKPETYGKGYNASQVYFTYDADEGEDVRATELKLDKEVWEQMDSPTTITVTIEPGDKLNEEGS